MWSFCTSTQYCKLLFTKSRSICYRFNNEKRDVATNIHTRRHGDDTENKQYDATISATFPKNQIQDKTSITCLVKIENSDYEKTETVTFVGKIFQLNQSFKFLLQYLW